MLELYHHGSSACAAKVRFALAEKQLEWTSHYIDILSGEQFRPDFLTINPKAIVPVLIHDGFVLPESTIICEYLEDSFSAAPRIYPGGARERALIRNWTKAVDEELHPTCSAITYIVSHRHTILRGGLTDFETFLKEGGSEGLAARTLKWQWIQHGIEAPGAADRIKPAPLASAEPRDDWDARLQALRGTILLGVGRKSEARALLSAAVAAMEKEHTPADDLEPVRKLLARAK